jgi:hypothetical protein
MADVSEYTVEEAQGATGGAGVQVHEMIHRIFALPLAAQLSLLRATAAQILGGLSLEMRRDFLRDLVEELQQLDERALEQPSH